MGVRFVIGRAGTGKTKRCFDAIVDLARNDPLGPPIFWILPKQATFTAERWLTCDSGLPAFTRIRVVSFQQLGDEILAECGGVAIPQVTALGRQMVLGHLLRQKRDELRYFRFVAHQPGLAAELDAIFAEIERCNPDQSCLSEQLSDMQLDPALRDKLHDLHLLYTAYTGYLGQDRLDPHQRLKEVLDGVKSAPSLRKARIFVDGFYEFTDYERQFLVAAATAAANVEITLTLDPSSPALSDVHQRGDELSMFHLPEDTYRRLHLAFVEADIAIDKPELLQDVKRFDSPALKHLECCLFVDNASPSDDANAIEMIQAPDLRTEVDAAARTVLKLIQKGLRRREIAVFVRDMDTYHELIDASFREHRIPWFVDRRQSASHHPLIQFTRALPQLAIRDMESDSVLAMLKSGLVPLAENASHDAATREICDELENYVLRHRIRGRAWLDAQPWSFHLRLLARDEDSISADARVAMEDDSRRMDAARRKLVDSIHPFLDLLEGASDRPVPLREIAVALVRVFDSLRVRETVERWIERADKANRLEQKAEHTQVWEELIGLLDQMVELLGDQAVTANDFIGILESGLASFDLALTPPTIDQVLVGSVERTRTPANLRGLIMLGLNEGSFPKCPTENSILCDGERQKLAERNVNLDPDTRRQLFDERFLAYIAFTRASENLTLTRPMADDLGRPLAPSSFWEHVRSTFPKVQPTTLPRNAQGDPDCIGTPRQLVTSLLRWVRAAPDPMTSAESAWPALYQRFVAHPCCDDAVDAIDMMRYRAWRALSYDNAAVLSPEVIGRLFPNQLDASITRLEAFAACPFKHFASHGLRLEVRDDQDVTDIDLGNAYHSILENLVREMVKRREDFASAPRDFTDEQIKQHAQKIGQTLRGEVLLSNARNEYILKHVERTLGQVIETQREIARRGKFHPWKTELLFGPGRDLQYSLSTPGGHELRLRGKIDRVDVSADQSAFSVIDYKLSENTLSLSRVYHGLSLQLLTYLLVLQNAVKLSGKKKLAPAAAFYVKLARKLEKKQHPSEATPPDDPTFHLQDKPRGLFDRRFLDSLDNGVTPGESSEVVHAYMKKDGTLGKNSDALESAPFASLLKFVEQRLGELADQIIAGDVNVAPYRIGTATPCPSCNYRSVCRFDPARQGYRTLASLKPEQVIGLAQENGGESDG